MSKQIEDMGGGLTRETDYNAPVIETENARFEQVGPWIQDNPGAAQAATAMTYVGLAGLTGYVAGRAGTIVGVVARSNADLTAGSATATATKGGVAVSGATAVMSNLVQQKVTNMATSVNFAAGDILGITITTDAGYLPVTADMVAWLMVRWSANST